MLPRRKHGYCRAPLCDRTFKGTQGLRVHHRHSPSCDAWYKAQARNTTASPRPAPNDVDPSSPLPWSTQVPPLMPSAPRRNKPVTIEDDDVDDGLGVDLSESGDELPSRSKTHTQKHPTAAKTYGKGRTVMQDIDEDVSIPQTKSNIYHPFISKEDFEMGAWLSQSHASMSQIDNFLKLPYVS